MADDTKTESPVQIFERDDVVVGQPQASQPDPHDGKTRVQEIVVHTDKKILDPNDPLAVQVPEGVGASTADHSSQLAQALKAGTAEEQFAAERENASEEETPAEEESETQEENKS